MPTFEMGADGKLTEVKSVFDPTPVKTVTLAQLTERFGLPADQQQGVYAWTNAHGDPSGDSALWTEEEAAELVTVWMDTNRDEYMADADTVDVEYHAEGGETVHEVPGWVTGK